MTTDRCPACAAAVTPGAPWCTLCYADLREPVSVAAAPAVSEPAPVAAPLPEAPLPPDPILDAPVHTTPVLAPPGWPCRSCGATVALTENTCPHCGSPFLEPEAPLSVRLPGVGDVTRLEKPQRIGLMFAGMAVATALFVLLAFLVGAVL